MRGYGSESYGEAFADVYDDWYADVSDIDSTVATLADLVRDAGGGPVLELGVGTGRLALPLAAAGVVVHGVDASPTMLATLRAKPGASGVVVVLGDMVDDAPSGPYAVVFVAYNTLFNLPDESRQTDLFRAVHRRLDPGGVFVVEAFVPDDPPPQGDSVRVRSMTSSHVVLSVERHDPASQVAEGHFVELSESAGVRLRPWSIRWATPAQIDAMAEAAGFVLDQRWSGFDRRAFDPDGDRHVSVYRKPGANRESRDTGVEPEVVS